MFTRMNFTKCVLFLPYHKIIKHYIRGYWYIDIHKSYILKHLVHIMKNYYEWHQNSPKILNYNSYSMLRNCLLKSVKCIRYCSRQGSLEGSFSKEPFHIVSCIRILCLLLVVQLGEIMETLGGRALQWEVDYCAISLPVYSIAPLEVYSVFCLCLEMWSEIFLL